MREFETCRNQPGRIHSLSRYGDHVAPIMSFRKQTWPYLQSVVCLVTLRIGPRSTLLWKELQESCARMRRRRERGTRYRANTRTTCALPQLRAGLGLDGTAARLSGGLSTRLQRILNGRASSWLVGSSDRWDLLHRPVSHGGPA